MYYKVSGWDSLPAAGDLMLGVPTLARAQQVVKWRTQKQRAVKSTQERASIEERRQKDRESYKKVLEERRSLGWCMHVVTIHNCTDSYEYLYVQTL